MSKRRRVFVRDRDGAEGTREKYAYCLRMGATPNVARRMRGWRWAKIFRYFGIEAQGWEWDEVYIRGSRHLKGLAERGSLA